MDFNNQMNISVLQNIIDNEIKGKDKAEWECKTA